METPFHLEKRTVGYIKGVAILLMFLHHFYGLPGSYPEIPYPPTLLLKSTAGHVLEHATRICVGLFAFLSGYAASVHPGGFSLRYGLKKSWGLLERYWLILFGIFLPLAIRISGYAPTPAGILLNMFALRGTLNEFAWYVYFFLFAMAVLPGCIRLFGGKGWLGFLIPMALCGGLSEYLSSVQTRYVNLLDAASQCFYMFPVLWSGYCTGENRVLEKLGERLPVNSIWLGLAGFVSLLICRVGFHNLGQWNADVVYAPLAVYFLSCVFQKRGRETVAHKAFSLLGKHSCNLWFLHALFFSGCMDGVFQRIVCLPKFPPLVLLFAFALCLPVSIVIEWFLGLVQRGLGRLRGAWGG